MKILGLLALIATSTLANADDAAGNPTTLAFAQGGTIHASLKAGAFEVVGTEDDRITVSWHSSFPERERSVRVSLRQSGAGEARIEIDGPGNGVQYRIEVPRRSNVEVSARAGDLSIRNVRGNLDAGLLAGNLELRVADPADYRSVRGSVASGGLSASPWRIDKGGLLRSFEVKGAGELELKAHVLAGQLTIRPE